MHGPAGGRMQAQRFCKHPHQRIGGKVIRKKDCHPVQVVSCAVNQPVICRSILGDEHGFIGEGGHHNSTCEGEDCTQQGICTAAHLAKGG